MKISLALRSDSLFVALRIREMESGTLPKALPAVREKIAKKLRFLADFFGEDHKKEARCAKRKALTAMREKIAKKLRFLADFFWGGYRAKAWARFAHSGLFSEQMQVNLLCSIKKARYF